MNSNTQTIARNSFWYGLELTFGIVGSIVASVMVANVIGPHRMGYFNYIFLLVNITATVGAFGLPITTRKYMAEFLGRGENGVARAIYDLALKLQSLIALGVTAGALALVWAAGDPAYRLISVLLILSMAPRMIAAIPAQAHNAAELMKRNTQPALIGAAVNIGLTLFSLWIGWDLAGVAAAFALSAALEGGLKLGSAHRLFHIERAGVISPELRRRMFAYSGREIVLMVLNIVVWDRSDVMILKWLNPDPAQITFFSLSFGITERILLIPNSFAGALGVTIMAQHGRDEGRSRNLTVTGAKYAFLLALPLMAGIASVSGPLIAAVYIREYAPMIPVLAVAALLAIPKALMLPASVLLRSAENQMFLIWSGCCCGALDIGLDLLLTGKHGALGAAIANGAAQSVAAIAIWIYAQKVFRLDLRLGEFGRIGVSGAAMAAAAFTVGRVVPGVAGLAAAVVSGALVWFVMIRLTGAIDESDNERLRVMGRTLPARLRPYFGQLVDLLAGRGKVMA